MELAVKNQKLGVRGQESKFKSHELGASILKQGVGRHEQRADSQEQLAARHS